MEKELVIQKMTEAGLVAVVRAKNACISSTYIGIDPVKFNKGFYAVTIKFYIKI